MGLHTSGPETEPDPITEAVDHIVGRLGPELIVGTPLGIGKPLRLLDAIYRRAGTDRSLRVHFLTALTLGPPGVGSDLERRLLQPILDRIEGLQLEPAWMEDLRRDQIPENVRVSEFFLTPGRFLGIGHSQRWHLHSNYTDVVRDTFDQGVNVIAQELAIDASGRLSLASNPDVTLDLLGHMRLMQRPALMVGVVNHRLPFTGGDAVIDRDLIDLLIDHPAASHEPYPVIAEPVSLADYAIGLQAAALIPDGGTIQLGIGSMANAVASSLILRHRDPETFTAALDAIGALERHGELVEALGGTGRFHQGLYVCSEMLSDGLLGLYDAGVVRRRVFPDDAVQNLVDSGAMQPVASAETLRTLRRAGIVASPLTEDDLSLLVAIGLLPGGARLEGDSLVLPGGAVLPAHLDDDACQALAASGGGEQLTGPLMHAAFYLGSARFYERLRRLAEEAEGDLAMTAVGFTNSLEGAAAVKRAQRRKARFVNQGMKMAADGALASHALEDGRTVSGVGGSFDFAEMARRLPDGRSISLVSATRASRGRMESNLVPSLSGVTIPAQHRDIVITEHGIGDLRGRSDGEVIEQLVELADARFQDALIRHGTSTGRLAPGYRPPSSVGRNRTEEVQRRLQPFHRSGLLPEFPFGSDLTDIEVGLAAALRSLQAMKRPTLHTVPSWQALRSAWSVPEAAAPYLERMGLTDPGGLEERASQRAVVMGLVAAGVIDPQG